jgi:hypothetical protein
LTNIIKFSGEETQIAVSPRLPNLLAANPKIENVLALNAEDSPQNRHDFSKVYTIFLIHMPNAWHMHSFSFLDPGRETSVKSRVGNKKPRPKTPPNKTNKNRKKTTSKRVFGFYCVF